MRWLRRLRKLNILSLIIGFVNRNLLVKAGIRNKKSDGRNGRKIVGYWRCPVQYVEILFIIIEIVVFVKRRCADFVHTTIDSVRFVGRTAHRGIPGWWKSRVFRALWWATSSSSWVGEIRSIRRRQKSKWWAWNAGIGDRERRSNWDFNRSKRWWLNRLWYYLFNRHSQPGKSYEAILYANTFFFLPQKISFIPATWLAIHFKGHLWTCWIIWIIKVIKNRNECQF